MRCSAGCAPALALCAGSDSTSMVRNASCGDLLTAFKT